MAKWKKLPMTEETTLGTVPTPALPSGPPVYWPRKVTLSGLPVRPTPLILSCGVSVVVLPFSENSCGEAGSDSELKDSRVTSRGTEVDLARRLPTGTARSAPPGSLDNLSVDLLAKERERELLSLDEVLMQSLKMTSEKANRETRF